MTRLTSGRMGVAPCRVQSAHLTQHSSLAPRAEARLPGGILDRRAWASLLRRMANDQMELTWAQRHHPDMPSVYDDAPDGRSLESRFREFHANNPHVYAELVKLARRARGRGVERIGIKMLWEVLRWQLQIETYHPGGDSFRLNNNFHSIYARLLMDENPELRGLFETRSRTKR